VGIQQIAVRVVKLSTVLAVGIMVGRSLRFSHGFLRLMPGCIGGNYIPRKVTLWHPKSNKIDYLAVYGFTSAARAFFSGIWSRRTGKKQPVTLEEIKSVVSVNRAAFDYSPQPGSALGRWAVVQRHGIYE